MFANNNQPINGLNFVAILDQDKKSIDVTPVLDRFDAGIICKIAIRCYDTTSSAGPTVPRLEMSDGFTDMVDQKVLEVQKKFQRIDMVKSYKAIFKSLWYATSPCTTPITQKDNFVYSNIYDKMIQMYYSNHYDTSVLKYCQWRGIPIPCAAIFTTFPTDTGTCCSFNLKAAQDIYRDKTYSSIVKNLQDLEKKNSEYNSSLPDWYLISGEPKTLVGKNKGLFVMLDAHSDLLAPTSLDQDYMSFTGLISNRESFPLMRQAGFGIKPGHHNKIILSGMQVDADENMRSLDIIGRQCIFHDESSDMKIFKNYTYANCIFECTLLAASEKYQCIPWYFPTLDDNIKMCNPWEAQEFFYYLHLSESKKCSQCLPECSSTIYQPSIMSIPFRPCDVANMEMSFLCKISNFWNSLTPKKYYSNAFPNTSKFLPSMNPDSFNIRTYGWNQKKNLFETNSTTYDAFNVDIATVEIYFLKPSVIQMGRTSKMTWIDFLSNVGGLMGLVLGMGFVSFVELFWLGLQLIGRSWNLI